VLAVAGFAAVAGLAAACPLDAACRNDIDAIIAIKTSVANVLRMSAPESIQIVERNVALYDRGLDFLITLHARSLILASPPRIPTSPSMADAVEIHLHLDRKFVKRLFHVVANPSHRPCGNGGIPAEQHVGRVVGPWPSFTCEPTLFRLPLVPSVAVKVRTVNIATYANNSHNAVGWPASG